MIPAGSIYEGEVRHRRIAPRPHEFRYRLFMPYVDVDRVVEFCRDRWFWSATKPNIAWFRRSDYLGPADRPLSECVRELVERRLGRRPSGAVRLLTHFRYFGVAMNPLSLYYCFDPAERLEAVVAEVSNTPWNERHWYVLDARRGDSSRIRVMASKSFHVSPFLGMDHDYAFELCEPDERLSVRIAIHDRRNSSARPIFQAALEMRRRRPDAGTSARMLARYPCLTLQVLSGIYLQALRLWWKGAPFFPHPNSMSDAGGNCGVSRTTSTPSTVRCEDCLITSDKNSS
jgi:DUF1365 family protein